MKNYIPLIFLMFSSLILLGQDSLTLSYKTLGLHSTRSEIDVPVVFRNGIKAVSVPSVYTLLGTQPFANNLVQEFSRKFPNFDSVDLPDWLLAQFEQTKDQYQGIHLFFGLHDNQLQVMIFETKVDTLEVNKYLEKVFTHQIPDNGADARHYKANYKWAYFWNNETRTWKLVEDEYNTITIPGGHPPVQKVFKGKLKSDFLTMRGNFLFRTKGYYISKALLFDIWNNSAIPSLTIFLGLAGNKVTLFLPTFPKVDLNSTRTEINTSIDSSRDSSRQNESVHIRFLTYVTHLMGTNHLTVRTCPSYCGDN
ncbi:hypothetical protein [Runella rosea]|nr:hypothetical protein [Runella rosea]